MSSRPADVVVSPPTTLPTEEMSPRLKLMLLANGQRISAVICALAEVDVAAHLVDGPRPVDELARLTGCHAPTLYRLMRVAAMFGVFDEVRPRWFALTELGDGLRSDLPDGVREAILLDGSPYFWQSFGHLLTTLRTGRTAFQEMTGTSFWAYLDAHPEESRRFDAAMTVMSRRLGRMYLERFDFGTFHRVADIGGGAGYFLAALLARYPQAYGVLFDRPAVVAGAEPVLRAHGVADRVSLMAGDFFVGPLPGECDLYLLKNVLHDWPDEDAVRILRQVRAAIGDRAARLLILEQVVEPGNQWDPAKLLDIDMLVVFGGRERTVAEWRELLAAGGFALTGDPVVGDWAVISAEPR
ncbi:MAG TPA: methyltransferase [Micromonospora sp.]